MGTRVSCKYFHSQLKDGCIRSYLCMRGENQENHRVELSDIDQNVLGKKQIDNKLSRVIDFMGIKLEKSKSASVSYAKIGEEKEYLFIKCCKCKRKYNLFDYPTKFYGAARKLWECPNCEKESIKNE